MALKYFDNVRHLLSTPAGTGDVTFGAVPASWQSLTDAGAVDGDSFPYRIDMGNDWELGESLIGGTVTTGTRSMSSSSTGSLLDLDGSAVMTCVPRAEDFVRAATDSSPGIIQVADQTAMEAASAANRAVTPGRQQYHPSAAKAWARFDGGTTLTASYNVSSIVDVNNSGRVTVNLTAAINNPCVAAYGTGNGAHYLILAGSTAVGTALATGSVSALDLIFVYVTNTSGAGGGHDGDDHCVLVFGDL